MEHLKLVYRAIKVLFSRIMQNCSAECTIPEDALETIARCVLPDIVKYFEDKFNKEKCEHDESAHLTKQAV